MITILAITDDYPLARKYLSKLRKIDTDTPFAQKMKARMSAEMGIMLASAQLDLDLFKISLELVNDEHGSFIYYLTTGAKVAFYCRDFDYSIRLLRSVLNRKKEEWVEYNWYLLPLEALIRYEQGDFDEVERLIYRVKENDSVHCVYAGLMLSTLAALLRALPHERGTVFESAEQAFGNYAATKEGKSKVERFDFGAWLSSKIDGLPITDIIRNQETVVNANKITVGRQEFL